MASYIIGFDIGHGQCSVAKMSITNNGYPEDLCLRGDKKIINSHILHDDKGEWILDPTDSQIGYITGLVAKVKAFTDSMKQPIPLGEDQAAEKEEICEKITVFLKALFKKIDLINQPGIIEKPDPKLKFACPSSWDNDEVAAAAYEEVINKALREYLESENSNKNIIVNVEHRNPIQKKWWVSCPTNEQISIKTNKIIDRNIYFEDSIKEPIPLGEDQAEAADREEICNKIKIFLKALFKTIDNNYQPGIISDPENVLYFACPSAWKNEEVKAYEEVIYEALCEYLREYGEREKPVKVIKESDAAYIASRKNWREFDLPDNPHILIIDFGSSTIDFTWYGDHELVHDGTTKDVGASKVENILFYYLKEKEDCARRTYEGMKEKLGDNNAKNILTSCLRRQKEVFYNQFPSGAISGFAINSIVGNLGPTFFGPDDPINDPYNKDKVDKILSSEEDFLQYERFDGRNYKGQVTKEFERFKNSDKMQSRQIDAVIITGGASRMPFVEEIAREVFGTNIKIIKDQNHNCDFVVSRGTAIWGRYHYLASPMIEDIKGKLKEDWGIISNNVLMCEGNDDDDFSIEIKQKIIDHWKDELHTITKDLYKSYIKSILSSWTNDDAYSYKIGHNLKAVLEPLRTKKSDDLLWRNLFDDLNKDENILVGKRSIHSLLRNIYDCIDGNDELRSNINETLKEKLKEKVKSNILPLLEEYYKVYFGQNAELPQNFLKPIEDAKVNAEISISFTDEEKKDLIEKLTEKTMVKISKGFGMFTCDSFNKNRIRRRIWNPGPGVHKIKNYLEQTLENFASDVNPSFNDESIEQMLKDYAESIKAAFLNIKKECQGSLYTPNSTVSQNLFGENGTTNPTNVE